MSVQSTLNPKRNSILHERAVEANMRGSWAVSIGLVLLNLAVLTVIAPLFQGVGVWYPTTAVVVACTYFVMQGVRQLSGNSLLSLLAGVASLLISAFVLADASTADEFFQMPFTRFAEFAAQVSEDRPPMSESAAVSFVIGIVSVFIAILVDTLVFAVRMPTVAPMALLPFVFIPMFVGVPAAHWYFWGLIFVALVLYLYLGRRWLQFGRDAALQSLGFAADGRGAGGVVSGLLSGVVALVVASLIAAVLPAPSGALWGVFNSSVGLSMNRINPILGLGDDLRRDRPIEIMRYATSQTEGALPYISLTTLTEITPSKEWSPGEFNSYVSVINGSQPGNAQLQAGARIVDINFNIVLKDGLTPYLPHIGNIIEISDLQGEYVRDNKTGDMREINNGSPQQSYQGRSLVPRPDHRDIVTAPVTFPSELNSYTKLPNDSAALNEIRNRMSAFVDSNSNPYEQALQLQSVFTGGAFEYSKLAPVEANYDGTSFDVINKFLQLRSGYCVHFSSAMAVMGRLLGIPTRIKVGTTPGSAEGKNDLGQNLYRITTDDLHAWTELWLPGYGWVPFETTPSEGLNRPADLNSGQSGQAQLPDTGLAEAQPEPTMEQTPQEPPASEQTPGQDQDSNSVADNSDLGAKKFMQILGQVLIFLLGLASLGLVLALPCLIRVARRSSRRKRVQHKDASLWSSSDAAWLEVLDTAQDYGLTWASASTVGSQLDELLSAFPEQFQLRGVLGRIAQAHDAARFANPAVALAERIDWDDVQLLRSYLYEHSSRGKRYRARFMPLSVMPQILGSWFLRGRRKRQRMRLRR